MKKHVVVITGATASGKSGLVYSLPADLPIEIINADSRQVYQNMKIGTALPADSEIARFPHHLFAFLSPREEYSAGRFARESRRIITEVHERRHLPVIVGGTFFYIRALWDGLLSEPEISTALRHEIEGLPLATIRKQLEKIDAKSFSHIPEHNDHRNRRALLVSKASGRPFSSFEREQGCYDDHFFTSWWIDRPRQELYDRINTRVVDMFSAGLLDEVADMQEQGYTEADPAMNTIGYKEILACHQRQPLDEEQRGELQSEIAKKTRHYAKRQLTWFRMNPA